ncbi:MAG: hypothetical protein H8M99_09770, partial [Gloeobacteraceae cyanobacterium ES-bin-144]|nr:hypothetical protein [Verrucomicrobiales bacterium]
KDRVIPVAEKVRAAIRTFEGANEVDLNHWSIERTRDYQRDLWKTVKESSFAETPVLSVSVTRLNYAGKLGDIGAWCDFSNIHPYPGGSEPETGPGLGTDLGTGIKVAHALAAERPIIITETGYHSASENGNGHVAVSEHAAGIYLPRVFLHNFRSGIVRSYWYELLNSRLSETDKEANFGLYRNDGITIKPAGLAMKNLIALLSDPGPPFRTGVLDYSLSDSMAQSVLFQKRNGEFWLALWLNSSLADSHRPYGQKQEVDPHDRDCTIRIAGVGVRVKLHERLDGESPISREISESSEFSISLSERVAFLQITVPAKSE